MARSAQHEVLFVIDSYVYFHLSTTTILIGIKEKSRDIPQNP